MTQSLKLPRKLIEVALPLDAINLACAKEKSIRHGHPSTLHLWWARRPLAAARAVIFAQLVNDPGYQQGGGFKYGKNKREAALERKRLFKIIEDLVVWENTTNEQVLEAARVEIMRSWREVCDLNRDHPQSAELFNPDQLPALQDPFAGGGAIPLEAQRLGMKAFASDLNPVAVMINKALIEIPSKFAGRAPVGPEIEGKGKGKKIPLALSWPGAKGLAEDISRYGYWMREEAEKRIGHLYPQIEVTAEMASERPDLLSLIGKKFTVIAWLWARTVKSPNPAFSHVDVPLISSFVLCSKEGQEVYLKPNVKGDKFDFSIMMGTPPTEADSGTKAGGKGAGFYCLVSQAPMSGKYLKSEAVSGRMGQYLFAAVADGPNGRIYLPTTAEMELAAKNVRPTWSPQIPLSGKARDQMPLYGMETFADLFTQRQLVALTTLSDLLSEAREKIRLDAVRAGMSDDDKGLDEGGTGARSYAEAVSVYLAFCLDKNTITNTTMATWQKDPDRLTQAFSRQAIAMTWDFAEANPLSDAGGGFGITPSAISKVLSRLPVDCPVGTAFQQNASTMDIERRVVSTDPPYYDNICYADLSDYFYVWLRKSLQPVYPSLFATVVTPKAEELVASPYRHSEKSEAEAFFLEGMTHALRRLAEQAHPSAPLTIYYAFKQSDTDSESRTSSTGWVIFLEAVHSAGLQLSGTWPMRTELTGSLKKRVNALASSIILVCRKRPSDAPSISRREFLRELNAKLPEALDEMTKGSGDDRSPVAPVDLSQAIIGPGMAVFSKYSSVLEADGSPMSVRTALQLINRFLAEDDFDRDTQFCLHWFEQYGWKEGPFGDAETLSRAKGTSVNGVRDAGVVESGGGAVRLLKWSDYKSNWDPHTDTRNPIWETLHHLIRALKNEGESGAGLLLAAAKSQAEATRQLAYRLYTLCERQGWAEDARAYNELITSWTGIETAAAANPVDKQLSVFE